jgi:glycerol-3-phosphate dehydrogenase
MTDATGRTSGVGGLDDATFDTVVIGGGILGAGVARELARRGLSTLLVERRDFAWGTTARSTRLIRRPALPRQLRHRSSGRAPR